jgi:hypothetical protein
LGFVLCAIKQSPHECCVFAQYSCQMTGRTLTHPKPFVRKAFAKYLERGIFAHGFARLPVRQWVLPVPKRLRYFMQREVAVLKLPRHAGHRCGKAATRRWMMVCKTSRIEIWRDNPHPAKRRTSTSVGDPVKRRLRALRGAAACAPAPNENYFPSSRH